jgi:uncharacterized protein (TIGR03437 family)
MPRFWLWFLVCAWPPAAALQPTTTTVTLVSGTPVYGATLDFRAQVGAFLGSIAFIVDGQAARPAVVDVNGGANTLLSFSAGNHTVGASFSASDVYLPSTATPLTVVVAKASTVVQLSAGIAQIGQPVAITALVAIPGYAAQAIGGTVAFTPASGCSAVPVLNGIATCNTSFPSLGPLLITAAYSGDANTAASSSTLSLTVNKAVPSMYLASAPAAPAYGIPVTLSALLLGAQGVAAPAGSVQFFDGLTAVPSQSLSADGRASRTAPLTVGIHAISAIYSGDANYTFTALSAPDPLILAVGKAPTVLAVSADPAQIGQPVTLRAAVSLASGTGSIAGAIGFSIGGQAVAGCTGVALSSASATCQTSFPQLGSYTLAGSFSGDANTLPSTASVAVNVNKAVPGIYLAFTPAAPVYGAPVTLSALVLGAQGVAAPTGTVTFSDAGTTLALQPVAADGHASFAAPLGTGPHTIAAVYNGDTNYQAAPSAPLAVTVAQAATATSLTALTGGPFTAVVTVVSPGAGSPTGAVQFRSGTTPVGSAPLVAQGSSFTAVLAATAATGSITATYPGDANFSASASSAVPVYPTQTLVTVTSDHNPSSAGQPVNFTVVVSISPRATAGPPTGAVTLSTDGAALGTTALTNGQAPFRAMLTTGSHTITASYSGDASYPSASGTLLQVVSIAAASLTVASSAPVAVYGQPVTLTALLAAQTGTIQFTDGAAALGSAPIAAGTASLPVNLAAGVHTITASWPGDGTWAAASAQLVQTVNQAGATISLAISGGALLALVTADTAGAGSPSGTVRFLDAATSAVLSTAALTGSTAAAPVPSSVNAVVAVYSGDANFLGATSVMLRLLAAANAASYLSASFAPDELVTLFGPGLSATGTTVKLTDSAGSSRAASLLFVSPAQATILMPADIAPGPATVTVTNPIRTLSAPIAVNAVAPGLFTADGSGQGAPAAQVIAVHPGGSQDDPQPATSAIDLSNPATTVYLVLYATGIRHAAAAPVCTIAGQPAAVIFAGAQGSVPGLDQVNVLIPASLQGSGAVPLTLTVDGQAANTVTLSIR